MRNSKFTWQENGTRRTSARSPRPFQHDEVVSPAVRGYVKVQHRSQDMHMLEQLDHDYGKDEEKAVESMTSHRTQKPSRHVHNHQASSSSHAPALNASNLLLGGDAPYKRPRRAVLRSHHCASLDSRRDVQPREVRQQLHHEHKEQHPEQEHHVRWQYLQHQDHHLQRPPPVEYNFPYYPDVNELHARVDLNGMPLETLLAEQAAGACFMKMNASISVLLGLAAAASKSASTVGLSARPPTAIDLQGQLHAASAMAESSAAQSAALEMDCEVYQCAADAAANAASDARAAQDSARAWLTTLLPQHSVGVEGIIRHDVESRKSRSEPSRGSSGGHYGHYCETSIGGWHSLEAESLSPPASNRLADSLARLSASLTPQYASSIDEPMSSEKARARDSPSAFVVPSQPHAWNARVRVACRMHERLHQRWQRFGSWFIVLIMACSATTSSLILLIIAGGSGSDGDGTDSKNTFSWLQLAAGGLAAFTTLLVSALQRVWALAERSSEHRISAKRFLKLSTRYEDIARARGRPYVLREDGTGSEEGAVDDEWRAWFSEFMQVQEDAPIVSPTEEEHVRAQREVDVEMRKEEAQIAAYGQQHGAGVDAFGRCLFYTQSSQSSGQHVKGHERSAEEA